MKFPVYFLLLSFIMSSCKPKDKGAVMKVLDHYPSASGIEYFDNSFYIIGDDAKNILVIENDLNSKDSIYLSDFAY